MKTDDLLVRAFQQNVAAIPQSYVGFVNEAFRRLESHPQYERLMSSRYKADAIEGDDDYEWDDPYRPYDVQNGTLVIPITGVLVADCDFTISGMMTGYPYISATYQRGLADPDVSQVVLLINSGGGEVNQCFELIDDLYANKNALPITTVVQGMAASAAYALASLGSQIYVSSTSTVGSIGVVATHTDVSESLAMQGVKVTKIYAGSNKINGDPAFPLSPEAYDEESAIVSEMYNVFVSTVARNRPILTPDAIIDTQAGVFSATQAIAKGLADGVSDVNSVIKNNLNPIGGVALANSTTSSSPETAKAPTTPAPSAQATPAAVDASVLEAARAEGAKAATERFSAIVGSDEASANSKLAMYFATKTTLSPEAAKEALSLAASAAPAAPVAPAAAPVAASVVQDNPALDDLSAAMAASQSVLPKVATQPDVQSLSQKPVSEMTHSDLLALSAKLPKGL